MFCRLISLQTHGSFTQARLPESYFIYSLLSFHWYLKQHSPFNDFKQGVVFGLNTHYATLPFELPQFLKRAGESHYLKQYHSKQVVSSTLGGLCVFIDWLNWFFATRGEKNIILAERDTASTIIQAPRNSAGLSTNLSTVKTSGVWPNKSCYEQPLPSILGSKSEYKTFQIRKILICNWIRFFHLYCLMCSSQKTWRPTSSLIFHNAN